MALEQFQNNEAPAEIPAEAPVKKEEPSQESLYANDAALRLHQKRAEYDKHLQTLIDKASQRQTGYNPKLMALGAGLLTPGKTGSFFEGLGTGTKGYMEAGEQEQKNELEKAKLENELRTGQIGQLEKDYALEQELAGDKYLKDMTVKRLKGPSETLAVSDVSGKPSARSILGSGSTSSYGSGPGGLITQEDIMLAPKGAQKRVLEDYKRQQEDIKINQEGAKSTEVSVPFLGTQKISVQQQQDISRIVNSPQYQALPASDKKTVMRQYYADNGIGEVQPEDIATTKVSGAPSTGMETTSQRDIRLEGEKETVKEFAKENVKRVEEIESSAKAANEQISDAKVIYGLAMDPKTKNAFGILAKPGVAAAIGEFVREPLKLGDISVGVSNIENIVRKLGGTQEEIDAAAVVARYASKLELGFSQAFRGQGQVSDNERLIVRAVGPNVSDSPKVAALKSESIVARAEKDLAISNEFAKWQDAHPNGSVRQFKKSPESKSIDDRYNEKLGNILTKYGFKAAQMGGDKPTIEVKKGSNLWESIQRAKEAE
jgi:hypothetical protein